MAHFVERPEAGRAAREALRRVPDLERALSRLALDRGGPRDLAAIRDGLAQAERLRGGARRRAAGGAGRGAGGAGRARGAGRRCWTRRWWRSRRCLLRDGGMVAAGYDAELDETRRLRDEGRGVIAELQGEYVAAERDRRAEDQAQQRARLLHRDAGDACREDAGAAAGRAVRPPPDHGERGALHHAGAGGDREEDPQRRRATRSRSRRRMFDDLRAAVLAAAGPVGAAARGAGRDRRGGGARRSGAWRRTGCAPEVEAGPRRSTSRGGRHPVVEAALRRSGAELRRQRLRGRRRRAGRAAAVADHRAEHGRQVDLPAAERADRDPGADGRRSCRRPRRGSASSTSCSAGSARPTTWRAGARPSWSRWSRRRRS